MRSIVDLDNDPGVLISACLFGDGAGVAVLAHQASASARRIEWKDSTSLVEPRERSALMFEQRDGMLRNILTRAYRHWRRTTLSGCWAPCSTGPA